MHNLKNISGWMGMLGIGVCLAAGPADPAALPEFPLRTCRQAPAIDGDLADACWSDAAELPLSPWGQSEAAAAARVRAAYDNTWLYIAFEITHPKPEHIQPTVFEPDGGVSQDDDVEVFIDPGTAGRMYLQYMLSAANTRAERRVTVTPHGVEREHGWDMPWRSATRRTTRGWNAEMALPLEAVADYGPSSDLRMNFGVTVVDPVIDPYGMRIGANRAYLLWAPVISSFHEPERFGYAREFAPRNIQTPFLPDFRQVTVAGYETAADGTFAYPLRLRLRNHSRQPGAAVLVAAEELLSGKKSEQRFEVRLKGHEQRELDLRVAAADLEERKITVRLEDPATGEVWLSAPVPDTSALVLLTAYADRNYYTAEPEAVIICRAGLPESELSRMTLRARDAQGAELARHPMAGADTHLRIPLAPLALGRHTLAVEACARDGRPVFTCPVEIIKRAPRPGREYKLDRINQVVLRDGRPFVPFGVIAEVSTEEYFKQLSDAGIKTILSWGYVLDRDYPGYPNLITLDRMQAWLEKYDMQWLDCLETHTPAEGSVNRYRLKYLRPDSPPGRFPESYPTYDAAYAKKFQTTRAALEKIRDNPRLIGYMNIDEPPVNAVVEKAAADYYALTQELDGYRPVFFNCGPYDNHCDIIGADPYWIPAGSDPRANSPAAAVHRTYCFYDGTRLRNYVADAARLRRPVWMVPMGEYFSGCHKRAMLPAENFCQTYLLLIHGVKGFFYFVHPFQHPLSLQTMGALSRQMEILGPIAGLADVPQTVKYEPGSMDPANNVMPDVHVALKPNPDGGQVLLAANAKWYPVDVTFGVGTLGPTGMVGRLFAADRYPVQDGAFRDRLEPYGVRAYTLGPPDAVTGGPAAAKIQISVSMTPHPELGQGEEIEHPRTGRIGKRNLVPNPSFEEASLPGWPDYFRVFPSSLYQRAHTPARPFFSRADAAFGLDAAQAWHGKASLRLEASPEPFVSGSRCICYLGPKFDRPTHCAASVYMRAERAGVEAQFIFRGDAGTAAKYFGRETFRLTTDWQRYAESDLVPAGVDPYNWFGLEVKGEGAVWIDGLQFETGLEPGAFEE